MYSKYNRREYVHPDPLEFLYNYNDLQDREIVGLIASSLAYGNVWQILKSVSCVLNRMGISPLSFIMESSPQKIGSTFRDFKHRFATGKDLTTLLLGIKSVIINYGSLKNCFLSGLRDDHRSVMPALNLFVENLYNSNIDGNFHLLPQPEKGSACKRLNLFLRWMVRSDNVDPGGWGEIPRSKLLIPLDTHMYKIGHSLGLTKRRPADIKTAIEITSSFARISPDDPVKYDFALTRPGIRSNYPLNIPTNSSIEIAARVNG